MTTILPFLKAELVPLSLSQLWLDKLEENFITLYGHREALQDT